MRILRIADVVELVNVSPSTLRRMEKNGAFPKRRRVSERIWGWLFEDVEAFIKRCPTVTKEPARYGTMEPMFEDANDGQDGNKGVGE
jgi:predicted DNA-binding transcriptional regulator AlpA